MGRKFRILQSLHNFYRLVDDPLCAWPESNSYHILRSVNLRWTTSWRRLICSGVFYTRNPVSHEFDFELCSCITTNIGSALRWHKHYLSCRRILGPGLYRVLVPDQGKPLYLGILIPNSNEPFCNYDTQYLPFPVLTRSFASRSSWIVSRYQAVNIPGDQVRVAYSHLFQEIAPNIILQNQRGLPHSWNLFYVSLHITNS